MGRPEARAHLVMSGFMEGVPQEFYATAALLRKIESGHNLPSEYLAPVQKDHSIRARMVQVTESKAHGADVTLTVLLQ